MDIAPLAGMNFTNARISLSRWEKQLTYKNLYHDSQNFVETLSHVNLSAWVIFLIGSIAMHAIYVSIVGLFCHHFMHSTHCQWQISIQIVHHSIVYISEMVSTYCVVVFRVLRCHSFVGFFFRRFIYFVETFCLNKSIHA